MQTDHPIMWTSNFIDNVSIELYDGPDLSLIVASDITNTGEFLWTIPADLTPAQNYTIRVFMTSDPTVEDTSDGPFTVLAPPSVTLTPYDPPVVIPSYGGGYWYWLEVANPTLSAGSGNAWSEIILPNGNAYGPLLTLNISLGPGETYSPATPFGQWIPAYAPPGVYEQVMHIGIYPNNILDTHGFEFEKLPGGNLSSRPEDSWSISDWPSGMSQPSEEIITSDAVLQTVLPSVFEVAAAYPNPFNTTTVVTVNLPEASELMVVVYNVTGQQVAELTNGQYPAGSHSLTFDASGMASGLYFIRATVPGQMNQIQKVILVR